MLSAHKPFSSITVKRDEARGATLLASPVLGASQRSSPSAGDTIAPVSGSRISLRGPSSLRRAKSNMLLIGPAIVSNEPSSWTRSPNSQLSSMKRRIEVWSVSVWST